MNEIISTQQTRKRLFDLLAIVIVALILLGLAWQVGQVTSQTPVSRIEIPTAAAENLEIIQDFQLRLPLERIGMELSQTAIPGDSAMAVDYLEDQCREVLAQKDLYVLSLAISEVERQLLNTIAEVFPVTNGTDQSASLFPLYPLCHPTGRVGIRELNLPAGDTASPERRLLCWGFILGEGTDSQTVWFARPREKLPGADAQSSTPAPSSRE